MTKSDFIKKAIDLSGVSVVADALTKLQAEEDFVIEEGGVIKIAKFSYAISSDGTFGNFQVAIIDQTLPTAEEVYTAVEKIEVAEGDKLWVTISGKNSVGYKILAQPLASYSGNGSLGPVNSGTTKPAKPTVKAGQNLSVQNGQKLTIEFENIAAGGTLKVTAPANKGSVVANPTNSKAVDYTAGATPETVILTAVVSVGGVDSEATQVSVTVTA